MEVHHSHQSGHKKKWTGYLLEFLMLFLAVFLGFMAENFREHKVEKHRAKQHMHTMMENLMYDTLRFGRNLRNNYARGQGLDSFRYEIKEALQGKVNANKLYYYLWKYGLTVGTATTNSSAMTQLKSSGMLRMIKNDSLVFQMGDYYERIYFLLDAGRESISKRRDDLTETYNHVFTFMQFDEIVEYDSRVLLNDDPFIDNYISGIPNRNPPLQLLSASKADLQRLYDQLASFQLMLRAYNGRLRYSHNAADSLMKHIKEEYHFE